MNKNVFKISQKDIELFLRMVIICIKFRISDDISISEMYRLYKKLKELQ